VFGGSTTNDGNHHGSEKGYSKQKCLSQNVAKIQKERKLKETKAAAGCNIVVEYWKLHFLGLRTFF
jgi:hypothetical protein